MTLRDRHISVDRLTALAFVARAPEDARASEVEQQALLHVSQCARCADRLAQLTADAGLLRDAARAQADEVFDEGMLDAQRTRILDRLAHLGQAARVLRFPGRTREATMPVSPASRRWISVAAAAGLIIGLVAGQLLRFAPWDPARDLPSLQTNARTPAASAYSTASAAAGLTDDELLDEIEMAVQLRRASSLRALDALTPTAADLGLGR